MFSPRWSTFTMLSLVAAGAVAAFCIGRLSWTNRLVSQAVSPPLPAPAAAPIISSQPAAAPDSVAPPPVEDPAKRWDDLAERPRTPAGEAELAALIEKLAEQDPQRTVALAAGQPNVRLRAALLRAALQGWGKTDPDAAAKWAQSETVMDPAQAINALLQGAVQNPDKAIGLTAALIQNDPGRASEFGTDLISTLTEAGQFERAANFAANGTPGNREDWMLPAYSRWAEFQPQAAMASAQQIADAGVRAAALNAIIVGWAPTDPKGLVEFAQNNLPPGQQASVVTRAIGFWADSDPAAAATWINENQPGPQTDPGVAQIALSPQLAQNPALAATWAENILNPQLRLETLTTVIEKWTAMDRTSAENYIKNSSVLTPENQTQLLAESQRLAELK